MKALTLEPDTELTVKQRRAIDNLYWHYRKQVWYWIEALPMPDAPDVVKPYSAFEDSSDESTRILGEQLERWGDLDAKEANDQILVLREKPSQTPKQQKAREKLERWNKLVGGS